MRFKSSAVRYSADIGSQAKYDTIISINVLGHIENHRWNPKYHEHMKTEGHLYLLVPACSIIYGIIDKVFGHCRGYELKKIRAPLKKVRVQIIKVYYFNNRCFFTWRSIFCFLKKSRLKTSKVKLQDRHFFCKVHAVKRSGLRLPI